ncbi:MAG: hypothetical protein ACPGVN_03465 [Alphaproteobacteria bacterium]
MMKKIVTVTLFTSFVLTVAACARKEQVAVPVEARPVQKIAQKVNPLQPTFRPKGSVANTQTTVGTNGTAEPISIPPIGS